MSRSRGGHLGQRVGAFDISFPATVGAIPGARLDFSDWLQAEQVPRQISDELAVVFSELVANAVNASASATVDVEACAWWEDDDIEIEIVNPSVEGPGPVLRADLSDQLRPRGRGLQIVQAFVDDIQVDLTAGGRVVVRCRRFAGE